MQNKKRTAIWVHPVRLSMGILNIILMRKTGNFVIMFLMFTHASIWNALDELAARHGYSASGLARRAGLDPTSFNKSKRVSKDGRPRWPSTESVAKALAVTGAGLSDFVALLGSESLGRGGQRIPMLGFAQAGASGYFDDAGYPVGVGWDDIAFPEVGDPHAFALEVTGDSMEPAYRDGDLIVVSPAASVRRGDRVVVKTAQGEVMAKELLRRTGRRVDLRSLNPEHGERALAVDEVAWIARILWASQ